jgi:predicted amidophosphoribosyltransferase
LLYPRPELLIPIPMPWPRLLRRGHDHAAEAAFGVSKISRIRLGLDILARRGWQPPQARLAREKRERNLSRAFFVRTLPPSTTVALVDDVTTTGATLAAAAEVLRLAGISNVHAIVIARHL